MATIEIDKVTKVYGNGFRAVDDVSLTIGDGEFVVLVGPSGCGKSTLLRMLAGLEEVTVGAVRIDGADVTDLAPRRRDIAMVFQNYALYPRMTVRENLGYGLKVRRVGKGETRRRVDHVAGLLGLEELLERKPAQLSGGQRQRVAMGRAIVREPRAFLMDEPLYVTHDQTEAMTLGQRVAVMQDGQIVQVDEPQVLYRSPRSLFVAAFIGAPSMNLVDAAIDGGTITFGQYAVTLDPANRPAAPARRVVLGIRPEAFQDGATASPLLPRLDVKVEVLEELGADTHVCFPVDASRPSVETGAGSEDEEGKLLATHSTLFNARVDARTTADQGARLELAVDPARFHFFSVEDGDALATEAVPDSPPDTVPTGVAQDWS